MALLTQVRQAEASFARAPEGGSAADEEDAGDPGEDLVRQEEGPSSPIAAKLRWALERSLADAHEAGVDLLGMLADAYKRQG